MFTKTLSYPHFSFVKNVTKSYIIQFGRNLRSIRKANGLSQEQLANDADIPINQIGRIERGEISTTIHTLLLIATALELPIKKLFDFEEQ